MTILWKNFCKNNTVLARLQLFIIRKKRRRKFTWTTKHADRLTGICQKNRIFAK